MPWDWWKNWWSQSDVFKPKESAMKDGMKDVGEKGHEPTRFIPTEVSPFQPCWWWWFQDQDTNTSWRLFNMTADLTPIPCPYCSKSKIISTRECRFCNGTGLKDRSIGLYAEIGIEGLKGMSIKDITKIRIQMLPQGISGERFVHGLALEPMEFIEKVLPFMTCGPTPPNSV